MNEIRLFLNNTEADLQTGWTSGILMTYQISDVLEPSAVKNSYSKTVSLPGTPTNNQIFSNYWKLDSFNGGFDPTKKGDFALYVDSELYQRGYFKLDSVSRRGPINTYNITLYGGLGEFLYNLENLPNGEKLQFKDIKIIHDHTDPFVFSDLGFTIDKDTVNTAWNSIETYSSPWSVLNFMPAYEGIPEDFGADKVLINTVSSDIFESSFGGWGTGTLDRELTYLEARDFRSYLQRPVARVRSLIESACYSENNGGYDVELDSHFFNTENPYYFNAWVTLPKLSEIASSEDESETTITGATLTRTETTRWGSRLYSVDTNVDFSEFSNLKMELAVNVTPDSSTTAASLYLCNRQAHNPTGITLNGSFVKYYEYHSGFLLQLVALDADESIVAYSDVYQLLGRIQNRDTWSSVNLASKMDLTDFSGAAVKTLYGYFVESGNTYTWCDMSGVSQTLKFNIKSNASWHTLVMRVQRPYFEYYKHTFLGGTIESYHSKGASMMFASTMISDNNKYTISTCRALSGISTSQALTINDFEVSATRYGGFLSGKHISHDKLLSFDMTPAQFLLSYCKIFGLYLWKDPVKKKIYIQDRDTFYNGEVVNLEDRIDIGADMTIMPSTDVAYYDFCYESAENETQKAYEDDYGQQYGLQRVNTGYEFNADHKEGYNGNFIGASTVLESSPYYYTGVGHIPCWVWNGMKYNTYTSSGSGGYQGTEHNMDVYSIGSTQWGTAYNTGNAGFDCFPKVQLHEKDNEGIDGDMILVFLKNANAGLGAPVWITDDLEQMVSLNSKQPCWLLTDTATDAHNNTIAIERTTIPQFVRDLDNYNGYITHSWEFGKPLESYVPATTYAHGSTVYERTWRDYIADMYNRNTTVVTAKVLLNGKPDGTWLRNFYWFGNSYWRINKISDWSPMDNSTTKIEFVRIQDLSNYALSAITYEPYDFSMSISGYTLEKEEVVGEYSTRRYYTVPSGTTSITGVIVMSDGSMWVLGPDGPGAEVEIEYANGTVEYQTYSSLGVGQETGYGNGTRTFNIGANTGGVDRTWKLCVMGGDTADYWRWCYVKQLGTNSGYLTVTRFAGSGNLVSGATNALMTVYSDSPWSATTDHSYETLSQYSGQSGYTDIQMNVEANEGDSQRTVSATFVNENNITTNFALTQNAGGVITDLDLTLSTFYFEPNGGTISGYVECPSSITGWSLSYSSWMYITNSVGTSGTTSLNVTAPANDTGSVRYGTISLWNNDTGDLAETINMTQGV